MGNKQSKKSTKKLTTNELSLSGTMSMPRTPSLYPQVSQRVSNRHMAPFLELSINNGVTGTFLSNRISALMYTFWNNHVDALSSSQKREVGSAIYCSMIATSKSVRRLLFKLCNTNPKQIERLSIQFLDMMGWIVRNLVNDKIDLYSALKETGQRHLNFGLTIAHFESMLQSMHETFQHYFDKGYSFEVKYAMDEIFILIARIMMGKLPKNKSYLYDVYSMLHSGQIEFLQSLPVCLSSVVGRDYFIRYLQQTWCDEIAIWLKSIRKFKSATNDKERFFIARNITKVSIQPSSMFSINISYNRRHEILQGMIIFEKQFACKQKLNIDSIFFSNVEQEMMGLMNRNHWAKFVRSVKQLKQTCASGTLVNPDLDDI